MNIQQITLEKHTKTHAGLHIKSPFLMFEFNQNRSITIGFHEIPFTSSQVAISTLTEVQSDAANLIGPIL
jgi:hypothetical protein